MEKKKKKKKCVAEMENLPRGGRAGDDSALKLKGVAGGGLCRTGQHDTGARASAPGWKCSGSAPRGCSHRRGSCRLMVCRDSGVRERRDQGSEHRNSPALGGDRMLINICRVGVRRMGPDSFQWCPATGQGATGTN